jgi:hypothetical protein
MPLAGRSDVWKEEPGARPRQCDLWQRGALDSDQATGFESWHHSGSGAMPPNVAFPEGGRSPTMRPVEFEPYGPSVCLLIGAVN